MTQQQQESIIYSHSLEDTSKGLRISAYCYANNEDDVLDQAFNTYLKARMTATDNKIPLAPADNR